MHFENGVTATLSVSAFTQKVGSRQTVIRGSNVCFFVGGGGGGRGGRGGVVIGCNCESINYEIRIYFQSMIVYL